MSTYCIILNNHTLSFEVKLNERGKFQCNDVIMKIMSALEIAEKVPNFITSII